VKIGIDIRPLEDGNSTRGIGSYVKNLLPELIKLTKNDEITLFSIGGNINDLVKMNNIKVVSASGKRYGKLNQALNNWDSLNIDEYGFDVFFEPDFNYPIYSEVTPLVIVAYDLIPLRFKKEEFMSWRGAKQTGINLLRYKKYLQSLKNYRKASRIIAISKFTAEDFKKNLKLNVPINVIYIGVNHISHQTLPAEKYVLYVGANEDRKNIQFLIKAFHVLESRHNGYRLKLVGYNFGDDQNPHTKAQKKLVDRLKLTKKVDFVGFVSDQERSKLYQRAMVFAFPSLFEGFGLPVLEAMQAGCPVVAFNNSSIPEVAGNAAILAKTEQEFIDGIERVISNKSERSKLIKAGFEQAKKFSWEKTAKETLKVLSLTAKGQV
jgi:glycosyltransferase involved in cell wall biosynthesis